MPMLWRIRNYIAHQFYRRHRKGFGIHSPLLFSFIREAMFNTGGLESPGKALQYHREAGADTLILPVSGPGAPSSVSNRDSRSVSSFVKGSSVNRKYGELLYRIGRWYAPEVILELGTGVGVSAAYLASGTPGAKVHTIEANEGRAAYATEKLHQLGFDNITVHCGNMESVLNGLKLDRSGSLMAYMDGNHRYDPTVSYARDLIGKARGAGLIVIDDIYWSKGMHRAWQEIIGWPEVKVSIDLFHSGILILREDLQKMHLKLNF